jgi:hypothetical protein
VKLPKFDDHLEKNEQRVKRTDKRKHHRRGFNEDVSDRRATRVNFKNYLRELKEEELAEEIDDVLDELNGVSPDAEEE